MISRRTLVGAGAALAIGKGRVAMAQQAGRQYRIGVLGGGAGPQRNQGPPEALRAGLREFGYEEGRNFQFEFRAGSYENPHDAARELVDLKVDIVVAPTTTDAAALKAATSTIPVVFWGGDAVASGLIQSMEHPGGNLTGVSADGGMHEFDTLAAIVPDLRRVMIVWNHTYSLARGVFEQAEAGARKKGLEVQSLEVFGVNELEKAFAIAAGGRAQAMVVSNHVLFYREAKRIGELALTNRLPLLSVYAGIAEHGGLIARPPDFADIFRSVASQIDRILNGVSPADLPVIVAKKFLLIVNRKTATTLGLTIPAEILQRADRIID
jgi:putative ABC transport system substrate-binding protein